MGEYSITRCLDRNGSTPLTRDSAVFVRRISPPLRTVYTIICGDHGRPHPWKARDPRRMIIRTGPVRLSTESVYLATWIPASQLTQQGDVATGMLGMGRDAQYEFQPSRQDSQLGRVLASRWQGRAPGFSALDMSLFSVMGEVGYSAEVQLAMLMDPPARRAVGNLIKELLEGVKQRELSGSFVPGSNDKVGDMRERLLTNPEYQRASPQRRAEIIVAWQRRL